MLHLKALSPSQNTLYPAFLNNRDGSAIFHDLRYNYRFILPLPSSHSFRHLKSKDTFFGGANKMSKRLGLMSWLQTSRDKLKTQKSPQGLCHAGSLDFIG